jgi:hypothetical protein
MDSVIKIAKADSATIKVSATASITSTNVLDEVFKVINVLPKAIDKKATIYVSTAIMRALKYAFGKSLSGLPYIINADSSVSFLGYTIIEAQGLADNNMFAGENGPEGNFVKLVDADTDQSNLNVIPMIQTLGIHTLRIVGAFKYAVGYIKSDEVVVYS